MIGGRLSHAAEESRLYCFRDMRGAKENIFVRPKWSGEAGPLTPHTPSADPT